MVQLKLVVATVVALLTIVWATAWWQVRRLVDSWPSSVQYVSIDNTSQALRDATVAMEDGHFYEHNGFDWAAIWRAAQVNWSALRIKQGGSTITQQLAKNLFLTKDRTIWRKLREAPLTMEMERQMTKTRILELYLNNIDYGMGQHGIHAAAQYYFHKRPDQLTLAESAALVGIVPNPPHEDIDANKIIQGQQTALGRILYYFSESYSRADIDRARTIPLDHLMYPFKNSVDRGATDEIPAEWRGVSFYFFNAPDVPLPIDRVGSSLKPQLAGFLNAARKKYHLVGIDHLGVYNDRSVRGSQTTLSSHAYGQAIDISGFRFADGSRIKVEDHDTPEVLARLQPLEDLLKKHFDIVVDWRDDPKRHNTHFHAEVKGPRPGSPVVIPIPATAPGRSMHIDQLSRITN